MWLGWGRVNGCFHHYRCKSGKKRSYQEGPKDRSQELKQVTLGSPHWQILKMAAYMLPWVGCHVKLCQGSETTAPRVQAGDVMSKVGREERMAMWRAHILTEDSRKLLPYRTQAPCCQSLPFLKKSRKSVFFSVGHKFLCRLDLTCGL